MQFRHARADTRREKCCACRFRWNRQATVTRCFTVAGGNFSFARGRNFLIGARRNLLGDFARRRRRRLFGEPRRVGFARFDVAEHSANRICFLHLRGDLVDLALARRCHSHDRFVCLDVDDLLIGRDFLTGFDFDFHNRGLSDRLAQLRHDDCDLRHKYYSRRSMRALAAIVFALGRCALHKFGWYGIGVSFALIRTGAASSR